MIGNQLVNAACEYAERSERLRVNYRKMSKDYLEGRIDQYGEGLLPNIPLLGSILESREIRIMKSILEEKSKESIQ